MDLPAPSIRIVFNRATSPAFRDYSVLSRWFVGLSLDDRVWDATTFAG